MLVLLVASSRAVAEVYVEPFPPPASSWREGLPEGGWDPRSLDGDWVTNKKMGPDLARLAEEYGVPVDFFQRADAFVHAGTAPGYAVTDMSQDHPDGYTFGNQAGSWAHNGLNLTPVQGHITVTGDLIALTQVLTKSAYGGGTKLAWKYMRVLCPGAKRWVRAYTDSTLDLYSIPLGYTGPYGGRSSYVWNSYYSAYGYPDGGSSEGSGGVTLDLDALGTMLANLFHPGYTPTTPGVFGSADQSRGFLEQFLPSTHDRPREAQWSIEKWNMWAPGIHAPGTEAQAVNAQVDASEFPFASVAYTATGLVCVLGLLSALVHKLWPQVSL